MSKVQKLSQHYNHFPGPLIVHKVPSQSVVTAPPAQSTGAGAEIIGMLLLAAAGAGLAKMFWAANPHSEDKPELPASSAQSFCASQRVKTQVWADDSPAPYSTYTAAFSPEPEPESHSEIKALVDEGVVAFIGAKGSGKTEKQAWLMAEHLKRRHKVERIDPFVAGNEFNGVKVWGRALDYKSAAAGIQKFTDEAKSRIRRRSEPELNYDPHSDKHWHLALDELSNYGEHVEAINADTMSQFWEICTQFLRQVNMSVSLAGHGDTQVLMGGAKALRGKSKSVKKDTVFLECQAVLDKSVKGNKRCAGWANIWWMEGDKKVSKKIDIPDWMRAPNQERDFSHLSGIVREQAHPEWQISDDLPRHLGDILAFALSKKEPITPLDVWQSSIPSIVALGLKAHGIHYCFEQLAQRGLGVVQVDGERVLFEPLNQAPEPLNQPQDSVYSDIAFGSHRRFTALNLSREDAIEVMQKMREHMNQTEIIECLWQCKKGGSKAYQDAISEYKQLMEDEL